MAVFLGGNIFFHMYNVVDFAFDMCATIGLCACMSCFFSYAISMLKCYSCSRNNIMQFFNQRSN